MGRRGKGEGTIYRRADGRWVGAITRDGDGVGQGRPRRRYVYGKTRQEVQKKLAAARREADQGIVGGDARQTVEAYFLWWLETQKPLIRFSTHAGRESAVRLYIVPALGGVRLSKLSAQHVQDFLSRLMAGEDISGRQRARSRSRGSGTRDQGQLGNRPKCVVPQIL
jgi:integrase